MARDAAFTLIELLISVSVLAVLLGVAGPALGDLVRDGRLISLNNSLNSALQLARSEAVKHRRHVVACKSRDGATCTEMGAWEQGWIVFHDLDRDHQCGDLETDLKCVDGGRIVLTHQGANRIDIRIDGGLGNTGRRVVFGPAGFATGYAGTFSLCDRRGLGAARGLVISMIGRIRQARMGDDLRCPD